MADALNLGLNTTVIGMGIVFLVLVALWALIAVQSRAVGMVKGKTELPQKVEPSQENGILSKKSGSAKGELVIPESITDEDFAAILSTVSEYTDIPLDQLSVRSVREVA